MVNAIVIEVETFTEDIYFSGVQLRCGIHKCSLKCHPSTVIPHDQILCQQITEERCPLDHRQSRKCHEPLLPCRKCERDAAEAEDKLRREFELQQKKEAQQVEHERRLKGIQDQINAEEQVVKDAVLAQQRAQIIHQKQLDLEEAKARSTSSALFSFLPSFISSPSQPSPSPSSNNPTMNSPPPKNSSSGTAPSSKHPPQSPSAPPLPQPQSFPGIASTAKTPSPEAEWQRQKQVEGASSAPIDAIMSLIGLEDVKRQVMGIKDKIEVTQRQNNLLNDERFNVVFLGNPGTGEYLCSGFE